MEMNNPNKITILGADRLQESLIIAFSDGRSGQYSTELLYNILGLAKELSDTESPDARAAKGTCGLGAKETASFVP